jgi:hypothetical protein
LINFQTKHARYGSTVKNRYSFWTYRWYNRGSGQWAMGDRQ